MAQLEQATPAVFETLRGHVSAPLDDALRTVRRETAEVEAEKRAFAVFGDRVAAVETVSTDRATPAPRTYTVGEPSRTVERVRNAFRETVMSVDHYEGVYDESLDEHAAAELSADVAAALQPAAGSPLTHLHKRALMTATATAIEQRETLLDALDGELASLEDSREAIDDLLEDCAGAGWGQLDVAERLDEIAYSRQETVQSRGPIARTDGHDLCTYLYRDEDWTYPVLTAVARFRTAT